MPLNDIRVHRGVHRGRKERRTAAVAIVGGGLAGLTAAGDPV